MKWNDNRRVCHYLSWLVKQKGHIFIDNKGEVHVFKIYIYIYTKTVNKENKYTTKTNILSFCLENFWVSNLLGLRDGGVWSFAFSLIVVLVLALGSFNFLPLASILARIYWNFYRSRRSLICCRSLRHLGRLLWGRRARTWELSDVRIIVYALRSSQAGISRDPSGIKGFTLSDIAVIPSYGRKLLSKPTLSLLYPQGICSLLFSLSCPL